MRLWTARLAWNCQRLCWEEAGAEGGRARRMEGNLPSKRRCLPQDQPTAAPQAGAPQSGGGESSAGRSVRPPSEPASARSRSPESKASQSARTHRFLSPHGKLAEQAAKYMRRVQAALEKTRPGFCHVGSRCCPEVEAPDHSLSSEKRPAGASRQSLPFAGASS